MATNKGGRPAASNPRFVRVGVRLTLDEYERALAAARTDGVSELLRRGLDVVVRGDVGSGGIVRRA